MGGLIPLLLPQTAATRSSSAPNPLEIKRPASAMDTATPTTYNHRRQTSLPAQKLANRMQKRPLTPQLPSSPAEWKTTISEVKRQYVAKKYRACSTRCCQILENLKDPSSVETLHLIYLHFYAASSTEMHARPLSQSSVYRAKLLRDARGHYGLASALIKKAEEELAQRTRSASASSMTPSLLSPSLSSSRSSTISNTSVSTVSSTEDLSAKAAAPQIRSKAVKPKRKKKVSFSGLEDVIEIPNPAGHSEPYVRPDSPTLGVEEVLTILNSTQAPIAEQPEPDSPTLPVPQRRAEKPKPEPLMLQQDALPLKPDSDKFDLEEFLQTKSMNRMCAQLADLRAQVAWHRDEIDTLLAVPDDVPSLPSMPALPTPDAADIPPVPPLSDRFRPSLSPTPTTGTRSSISPEPESPITPFSTVMSPPPMGGMTIPLRTKRSLESDGWRSRSPSITTSRPGSAASVARDGDEAIQKRIERLRAQGWQRKRFDTRRYEALREQVLGELETS